MDATSPIDLIAQGVTPEGMIARGQALIRQHRDEYILTRGAKGHIRTMTEGHGYDFSTHCLLRTVGRKSGRSYVNPLYYTIFRSEIVLIGSAAGSRNDPSWSRNLRAAKEAQIQIAGQAFQVTWRLAEGAEREKIWDFVVATHPPFGQYQSRTQRQIPVILLRAVSEIPVFSESAYD